LPVKGTSYGLPIVLLRILKVPLDVPGVLGKPVMRNISGFAGETTKVPPSQKNAPAFGVGGGGILTVISVLPRFLITRD
jgi:hypothetical protein